MRLATQNLQLLLPRWAFYNGENLTGELRDFALHIAELCARIGDKHRDGHGSTGDEIRAVFDLDL